jgi:cytidine deaminase
MLSTDRDSRQAVGPAQLDPLVTQQLWHAARAAHAKAYAPYSRYSVGAAILDEHGVIHTGCNIENASYPQGWCAEASALSALVMSGARRARGVLVVGTGGVWITPCGGCRQKLREFCDPDSTIVSANLEAIGPVYSMEQLLPHSFGPDHLKDL